MKLELGLLCEWQDRQCTCHATTSYVCATFAAVEKQWVLRILSVCLWP